MKNKLQNLGFTVNHIALLGIAIVAFAVLILPHTGFKISGMFAKADQEPTLVTFDQTRDQIYAEAGIIDNEKYLSDLENQFALLDRGEVDGKVLGETIGIGEVPSVDQLYSDEQLALIPIKAETLTTTQSVQTYSERMLQIESYYNTTEMFSNLNSTDTALISKTVTSIDGILSDMSQLQVPSELVAYHKYNVLYYQSLKKIADSFLNDDGKLGDYTAALFSLMDKIGSIKTEINSKYGVQL